MAGLGFAGYAQGGGASSASPTPSPPGYYDLPGSQILPGGNLRTPQGRGMPGQMPGVDIPVVGYPATGWNPNDRLLPPYQSSIPDAGLPYRGDIGGGPGGSSGLTPFDPLGYGVNPPPNENVTPGITNNWLLNSTTTDSTGRNRLPPTAGPDLSGMPPVTAYPNPASGYGNPPSGNWRGNATRAPYADPWRRQGGFTNYARNVASSLGFGSGSPAFGPLGGSDRTQGFATISEFPTFGGFGSVGNSGYGNVKYIL